MDNHPGRGNASLDHEQRSIQEQFIQTNLKWDEYLFSYRRIPKFLGSAMHRIRLVELSKSIHSALAEGLMEKKLMDGRTVRQAYIDKIAQTRSLINFGCDDDTIGQLEERIKANDKCMQAILKFADKLLSFHKLLLTDREDEITSADVYLAVLLTRIAEVDNELYKETLAKYPEIETWWETFNMSKELNETLKAGRPMAKIIMLLRKAPKLALFSLGMLNPDPLPDDIEQDVEKEMGTIMTNYCKT